MHPTRNTQTINLQVGLNAFRLLHLLAFHCDASSCGVCICFMNAIFQLLKCSQAPVPLSWLQALVLLQPPLRRGLRYLLARLLY